MSNQFGKNIQVSIFGESHGDCVGVVINGLTPGIKLDTNDIQTELNKRKPGSNEMVTPRIEEDKLEIKSGLFNGFTTGAPLMIQVSNQNQDSSHYEVIKNTPRPSHADFSVSKKYHGYNDYRGGGHFSGRLTISLVIVGAICKKILSEKGIYIGSQITKLHNVEGKRFTKINKGIFEQLDQMNIPTISTNEKEMIQTIDDTKKENDSIGGIVEIATTKLPIGIGEPFFDSVESYVSHLMFSIPGIKGIEFGSGFNITNHYGSQVNDQMKINKNGEVEFTSNNSGGILGGITNGENLVCQVAIKPTPSIKKEQRSVNLQSNKEVDLKIEGRHDPAIILRARIVCESVIAFVIYDLMLENSKE